MILMNDFKAEPLELKNAMLEAVRRVIESGRFVLGDEVSGFEAKWASVCGVTYGIGLGNGMDAIEVALRVLDIGPGDEVITTPMTAYATVLAILRAGAVPVLADIDPDTALLSQESVSRCINSNTKAVVLVHLYGQVRDMDTWVTFCSKNKVYLIEDCAQAHNASWQGKVAGSFGIAGAYSFYPTKNLGALGDAGMLVTSEKFLAERAQCMRNYGQKERYFHPEKGLNSRLDEIQAAILSERLKWLGIFTKRRRTIAEAYISGINNPKVKLLAKPKEESAHVYHLFVVRSENRQLLEAHLKKNGVQTLIHYPVSVHQQLPCLDIARDPLGLKNCEDHAASCISLPCHPQMNDASIACVIDAINSFGV